jgi:hypothetical protein
MELLNQASFAAEPLSAARVLSKQDDSCGAEEIRVEIAADVVFAEMLKQARGDVQSPFSPMMMP